MFRLNAWLYEEMFDFSYECLTLIVKCLALSNECLTLTKNCLVLNTTSIPAMGIIMQTCKPKLCLCALKLL